MCRGLLIFTVSLPGSSAKGCMHRKKRCGLCTVLAVLDMTDDARSIEAFTGEVRETSRSGARNGYTAKNHRSCDWHSRWGPSPGSDVLFYMCGLNVVHSLANTRTPLVDPSGHS